MMLYKAYYLACYEIIDNYFVLYEEDCDTFRQRIFGINEGYYYAVAVKKVRNGAIERAKKMLEEFHRSDMLNKKKSNFFR